MQNYMTKLNNIKKYILPFLFLVMTFVMIPKAAYYKKENITIKVETIGDENAKGSLFISYPKGYEIEKRYYKINSDNFQKKINNTIVEKYCFRAYTSDFFFKDIKINEYKKNINKNQGYVEVLRKEIEYLYNISLLNIIIYLFLGIVLAIYFFQNGLEMSKKNIGIFLMGLVFLSIGINFSWLSKTIGLFFSMTFFKIIIERKKIKYGKIEIVLLILLILSIMSEFFSFKNYKEAYDYFQNTLFFILCAKVWDFDFKNRKNLKKFLKHTLILLATINILSPLVMGGIYSFTFGILMSILCLDSLNNLLKIKNLKKRDVLIESFAFIISSYGVVISSRRTMMVAIVVYIIYILINKKIYRDKKALIGLSISLFSIYFILNKNMPGKIKFLERKVSTIATIKGNDSNYQRFLMWRRGYYILKENPVLGIGANSFYKESIKEKYNNIKLKDEKFIKDFIHVHNEYIHQVITRGIPGAILFYGLWIYMLSRLRKSKDKDFDVMLLIIYGVYGIFDPYSIRAESIVFYTFIGISFVNCLPVVEKENKILQKLGYISTVIIFLIALYFNKRFRYYFLILLVIYIGYYFYNKRKREKYERI